MGAFRNTRQSADLSLFSDDDLREEFEARDLGGATKLEGATDAEIEAEFERRELGSEKGIADFDDDEIVEAYAERGLGYKDERDVDLLAELICAGEHDRALDLLRGSFDSGLNPSTIKRLVAERQARCGRLF